MELIDTNALKNIFAELVEDPDARIAYDNNWNRYIAMRDNGSKGAVWTDEIDGFSLSCETVAVGTSNERRLTILDEIGRGHTWSLESVWGDDDYYIHSLDHRESHGLVFAAA